VGIAGHIDEVGGRLVEKIVPFRRAGDVLSCAKTFLSRIGAPLLVGMEGARVIGACLANRIASIEHGGVVLFVEELYVAPDRRRGVARALLLRLLADGHTSGIRAVELQVDEGHESARAVPQPRIRDELSNGVGRRSSSLTQDA